MQDAVEVAIIGGGIHGAATAYHLAGSGVQTRLYERGSVAAGPTARSSAVCRGHYVNRFLARIAAESIDIFRRFPEVMDGRESGYHGGGILYLHPEEDLADLRETAGSLNAIGTRTELLWPDELRRLCSDWHLDDVAIGAWEPDAGYADPVLTTQAYYDLAVARGLEGRLYCDVLEIEAADGGGAVLTTQDGLRTYARKLVLCAGPWTKSLAAKVGADLPLTVERHCIASFAWGGAPRFDFTWADIMNGTYTKPEGAELFIIGTLHNDREVPPDDFAQSLTDDELFGFVDRLTRRVPGCAAAESRGGWAALYDLSPDWQPVIGEIEDGIFVDAGTSGHGFKLAPGLCREIANLVIGRGDPEIDQFHPRRFAAHRDLVAGYGSARILG